MFLKLCFIVILHCLIGNICLSQTFKDSLGNNKDSLITINIIEITDSGKVYSEIKEPKNYVNPFGPISYFSFIVLSPAEVNLSILNEKGELILSNTEKKLSAGKYRLFFKDKFKLLLSGIYFYRIQIGDKTETNKIIIVK